MPPGSRVVDLGCGNGALTEQLAARGYDVAGVDASAEMLELAREGHPELKFLPRATRWTLRWTSRWTRCFPMPCCTGSMPTSSRPCWTTLPARSNLAACWSASLAGKGCAETVHAALEKRFAAHGLHYLRTFYFPTVGEYAPLLEKAGFRVEFATLFDRPTKQNGPDGLADWIRMFDTAPFSGVDPHWRHRSSTRP